MNVFMAIKPQFKLFLALLTLLLYLLLGTVIRVLPWRQNIQIRLVSLTARLLLIIFGIRYRAIGAPPQGLVVSNHLSYIDIMVIAALWPSIFIAAGDSGRFSPEVIFAKWGGSLMINRKDKSFLENEILNVTRALLRGFRVILFPEGTTFDGVYIRKFKIPFFASALKAEALITPICLWYSKINNLPITDESKKSVFFFEKISLASHFKKLLNVQSIDIDVYILPSINTQKFSAASEAADITFQILNEKYESLKGK